VAPGPIRLQRSAVICGMLDGVSSEGTAWVTRNVQVVSVFGPLLILTGALGFVLPPELSLMSGATPYNVFHLLAGAVAIALALGRRAVACIRFNLVFGCIDLWQALAGLTSLFPAQLFALKPADHVVHVVVGAFLFGVGYLGRQASV
jgi:hypothetical protein